jgi:hypothetical protein
VHFNPECAFTAHSTLAFSSFFYCCASPPYLGFSSKLYPKFLSNTYMSTMRHPCGFLIGQGCPTTLFEAQERVCEIEENIDLSLCQDEDCLEEIIYINQVSDLVLPDPPHNVRTYLQREREEDANQDVGHVMSLLGKDKETTSK